MAEEERSDSISAVTEKDITDVLKRKITEKARLSLQNVLGTMLLVFADTGFARKLDVEHVLQMSAEGRFWGLEGLRIDCIKLTLRKPFWQTYSVHILIPLALIRSLGRITVIESSGLIQADLKPEFVLYAAEPSTLGWAFLLEDMSMMLPIMREGKKLSSMGVLIEEMDQLVQKAIRLSIASKTTSELRAVPSPIVVKPEDFQEQIREKLLRMQEGKA